MQKQNVCGQEKFSRKAFLFHSLASTAREISDALSINGLVWFPQHGWPACNALVAREQGAQCTASPTPCTRTLAHASHLGQHWVRSSTALPASLHSPRAQHANTAGANLTSTSEVLYSTFLSQPVQHSTQRSECSPQLLAWILLTFKSQF